jgi:hypothetical protein
LRSGYGEPLRRFFAYNGVLEQIIDFGHAPIFEDADTFPCIGLPGNLSAACSAGKATGFSSSGGLSVPREKLSDDQPVAIRGQEGYAVPVAVYRDAWSLEPLAVDELMGKIRRVGVP